MALRLISQIVFFYILLFPVPYKLDYKEAQFFALQSRNEHTLVKCEKTTCLTSLPYGHISGLKEQRVV